MKFLCLPGAYGSAKVRFQALVTHDTLLNKLAEFRDPAGYAHHSLHSTG